MGVQGFFGVIIGLGILSLVIYWILFPVMVIKRMDRLQRSLEKLNTLAESTNRMQGDLNRAAQWLIDREGNDLRQDVANDTLEACAPKEEGLRDGDLGKRPEVDLIRDDADT